MGNFNRIIAQSSVLVFGVPTIMSTKMTKLTIKAHKKEAIIEELKTLYGISEETLFSDFSGYANANAIGKTFDIKDSVESSVERDD